MRTRNDPEHSVFDFALLVASLFRCRSTGRTPQEAQPTAKGRESSTDNDAGPVASMPVSHPVDASLTLPADPRAALIATLARSVADLAAAGDLAAARIAHETMGKLLETAQGGAAVVDLAERRRGR